ncbi:MAG: tRNA lysidine(34) synthetase TilS [Blastopirellula sp.]|nr:MAG: tRNA lysidine(34) synthetase TilS [Blastopirellula sp.]
MVFAFEQKLHESWPTSHWMNRTVLLAVSGGADSVSLACAMASIRTQGEGRLALVHFNHQLRESESDQDAQYVQQLADQLNVACYIGQGNVRQQSKQRGDGIEEAARNARYQFFCEQAKLTGARFVATAHTADDQVETVLQRIIRGTGVAGLSGIPRSRVLTQDVSLIRPLLKFTRVEVIAYLKQLNQSYREDQSNTDLLFSRNRVRHRLLPLLREEFSPDVDQAITRLSKIASDCKSFVQEEAEQLLLRCTISATTNPNCVTLNRTELKTASPYLVQEMFVLLWDQQTWSRQDLSHDKLARLVEMIRTETGHLQLPGNIQVKVTEDQVVLTALG